MQELIRIATNELAAFLSKHLPTLGSQWWTTHVEELLTVPQQRWVRERGLSRLEQLDFAALLRIVDRNWYDLSRTANLPREGRNWVRELQTVRNNWAHASAERAAAEDLYRDADTLERCLSMLGAKPESVRAVEAVKSTALRDMAAARGGGATPSAPPSIPTTPGPEPRGPKASETGGRVEVRDHVLWTKHIHGDEALKATINALSQRSQIDLEVAGCHGTWQKMNNGPGGQATPGIRPVGPARSQWHALVRDNLGCLVTIARASNAQNAATERDEQSFDAVWAQIQRKIAPGDTIRNWSRHSGYRGNDFTIHAVETRYVEINSPGAENIQHVAREHFARVHEHWKAYNAGVFARSRLTAITRFSTYVISILHHVFDSD